MSQDRKSHQENAATIRVASRPSAGSSPSRRGRRGPGRGRGRRLDHRPVVEAVEVQVEVEGVGWIIAQSVEGVEVEGVEVSVAGADAGDVEMPEPEPSVAGDVETPEPPR